MGFTTREIQVTQKVSVLICDGCAAEFISPDKWVRQPSGWVPTSELGSNIDHIICPACVPEMETWLREKRGKKVAP